MNRDDFSVQQLIHSYVMSRMDINMDSNSIEDIDYMRECAERDLYRLTRSEIINDFTESEKQRINQQVQQEAARQKAKSISRLLIESGLLALLIGLLVNQLTNSISAIFPTENKGWWGFLLCLAILILIGYVYVFLVYSGIKELLGLGDVNESDEP